MKELIYISILFIPIITIMVGWVVGKTGSLVLNIGGTCWAVLVSVYVFMNMFLFNQGPVLIKLGSWIRIGTFNVKWAFLFDSLTSVMLVLITLVTCLVQLYSVEYMKKDPHLIRFVTYLSIFCSFMLLLVTAGNMLQLFLGWEGVGLASYLLINFWFTRLAANKSAIKAVIVNRFGDIGVYLAIIVIFYYFRSLDFLVIFSLLPEYKNMFVVFFGYEIHVISLIAVGLFIGAIGKSAQIGLHTWLPDAMEGPTPVSALIHAATMVTAGVFLLIRCSLILEYSYNISNIILVVGAVTAFFGSVVGFFQNDIKKVIAYSTCSQLGYMFVAVGLGAYNAAIYHLVNHGFFKALLFLGAGSVIHAVGTQDIRRMGALVNFLPVTYITFLIGSLSLGGFLTLSGFYSKDLIIELAAISQTAYGVFSFYLVLFGAFFTMMYSVRLLLFVFLGNVNGFRRDYEALHESKICMLLPLIILSIFSVTSGYFLKLLVNGTEVWGSALYISAHVVNKNTWLSIFGGLNAHYMTYWYIADWNIVYYEYNTLMFKFLPLIIIVSAALFYLYFYFYVEVKLSFFTSHYVLFRKLYIFLNHKFYFDQIYANYFVYWFMNLSGRIFKVLDRGFLEFVGPLGFVRLVRKAARFVSRLQTGFVYNYVIYIYLSVFSLIVVILFVVYGSVYLKYKVFLELFWVFVAFLFVMVLENSETSKKNDVSSSIYRYFVYSKEFKDRMLKKKMEWWN